MVEILNPLVKDIRYVLTSSLLFTFVCIQGYYQHHLL